MSQKRMSVKRIMETLRLHFDEGKSLREISQSVGHSPSVVHDCLRRFKTAGLIWPLKEGQNEELLTSKMYAPKGFPLGAKTFAVPDYAYIHKEMKRDAVTLYLLWQEYKGDHPDDGYQYSAFCQGYFRWKKPLEAIMRQEHKAGEKVFVDWSGDGIDIADRDTGEVIEAPLFVSVLGASSRTFAKAAFNRESASWLRLHSEMFEYYGGVTAVVVPDNEKTGVKSPCRYDPELNPVYAAWARHYGTVVMPARPRKPKDKALVENGVLNSQRWILAALRNHVFFSLAEANALIAAKLVEYNQRKFQKLDESRDSLFETTDKPALRPLPQRRFEPFDWKTMTVHIDYHVVVAEHHYSVSYLLIGKKVDVRWTGTTVEILHSGQRVASHQRSYKKHGWTTVMEHRPEAHRAQLGWTPERFINWAQKTGPNTEKLIQHILESRAMPEQGYRACLGVMRLQNTYDPNRLENACARALLLNSCTYKTVESILKTGADKLPQIGAATDTQASLPLHDNVRGAQHYH